MGSVDYALRPPEVNSGLMYTGPGAGPMLAAAAGWDAVAANLESTASGYSSEISGLTGRAWSGPSSLSMTVAATPYVEWLQASAAAAQQTAAQAYAAAAAYEAAFAMTVPPPVITANRAQLMTLVATNFFGQNTPAIMATQAQYLAMWAQDVTAMYGYAAASEAASPLTPFRPPPRTTNPAGRGDQAGALARAAGNVGNAHTHSLAPLADPTLQPGNAINLQPGGTATLNPGTSVQVPAGLGQAGPILENATNSASTIDVTSGSIFVSDTPQSGFVVIPAHTSFFAYSMSGSTAFTVQSGQIMASGSIYSQLPASVTVAGGAVDVTGPASAFTWSPSTGILTVTGSVNVGAVAPIPLAPVTPGVSAFGPALAAPTSTVAATSATSATSAAAAPAAGPTLAGAPHAPGIAPQHAPGTAPQHAPGTAPHHAPGHHSLGASPHGAHGGAATSGGAVGAGGAGGYEDRPQWHPGEPQPPAAPPHSVFGARQSWQQSTLSNMDHTLITALATLLGAGVGGFTTYLTSRAAFNRGQVAEAKRQHEALVRDASVRFVKTLDRMHDEIGSPKFKELSAGFDELVSSNQEVKNLFEQVKAGTAAATPDQALEMLWQAVEPAHPTLEQIAAATFRVTLGAVPQMAELNSIIAEMKLILPRDILLKAQYAEIVTLFVAHMSEAIPSTSNWNYASSAAVSDFIGSVRSHFGLDPIPFT